MNALCFTRGMVINSWFYTDLENPFLSPSMDALFWLPSLISRMKVKCTMVLCNIWCIKHLVYKSLGPPAKSNETKPLNKCHIQIVYFMQGDNIKFLFYRYQTNILEWVILVGSGDDSWYLSANDNTVKFIEHFFPWLKCAEVLRNRLMQVMILIEYGGDLDYNGSVLS